jgi:hypothetical protein
MLIISGSTLDVQVREEAESGGNVKGPETKTNTALLTPCISLHRVDFMVPLPWICLRYKVLVSSMPD